MTKKKTALLAILMCGILWPALVIAHGQQQATASQAKNGTSAITITYLYPGYNQPNVTPRVDASIRTFEANHPNMKVHVTGVGWNNFYTKVTSEVQAGSAQDVIYLSEREIPEFVNMGALMDLGRFGINKHMSAYRKQVRSVTQYRGKYYAIPAALSTKTLIYRTDLIKDPPKTWDQIVSVAQKVMANHPGVYGYGMSGAYQVSTTSQFFNFLFQAGGRVFNSNGQVVLDSPAGVKALTFYADLYRKYHLTPNPIQYNREQLPQLFKSGKIAMFVDGPWVKGVLGVPPDNKTIPYANVALPSEKAGMKTATILVADAIGLYAKAHHPQAAWDLLTFVTGYKWQTKKDYVLGMVPMYLKAEGLPEFNNNPYFKNYVAMVKYGLPQPTPTVWHPFQHIMVNAIQAAITGDASPAAALKHAANQIRQQKLNPGS